ncbi:twin-arginine translocase TatA/TatE family subunit [Thermocrinis minervae]|uniref:Sec-independent protein translocase protein TatB n=1 Tax=Thermocrinis minervae TaxID=381751 RepID=A0A1M6QW17_9AQUI|nr:twin-arginine translocase TatA/TatE family subunit [Thermocrinis minervae]SHK24431.1 sec-independent protein translocase protein TatB [Thermocrinis minervae]
MELQLLLILAIAFVVLGPEKMVELAGMLGEALRKVREAWDELRYQLYLEELNRKIYEETKDQKPEEGLYSTMEERQDEPAGTPQDATDGTPEGTKKQAD